MRRNIILTSGTQVAIQAVGIVTGVAVARWLGPSGRGQFAAAITWASMLAYAGNLGLPTAFVYSSAREPDKQFEIFGNSILITAVQWPLIVAAGLAIIPFALASEGTEVVHLAIAYLILFVPLNLLTLYLSAIEQGGSRFARFNAIRLSVPISYLALLGVLKIVDRISVGTVVAVTVLSNVVALALALGLTVPVMVQSHRRANGKWTDRVRLRRDIRFGLSAFIGTLQPFQGMRLDVLMLTMFAPANEIGLYVTALAAGNVLRSQGLALGQVVFPEVAKRVRHSEQMAIIRRFFIIAVVGGAAAALVVVVWARPLLNLVYGSEFVSAALMLKIMVVGGALSAIHRVLADGLRGMGRPQASTWAELWGLAVGLPLLALFTRQWSGTGAALAVTVSTAVSLGVAAWYALRPTTRGAGGGPSIDHQLDLDSSIANSLEQQEGL